MINLIEKAKLIDKEASQVVVSQEHIDLSIAFLRGDVTMKACTLAMGYRKGATGAYITLTRALKKAYEQELIRLKT